MTALADFPHVTLSEAQLIEVRNGRPILKTWLAPEHQFDSAEVVARRCRGNLAAILFEKKPGELWPRMNFK